MRMESLYFTCIVRITEFFLSCGCFFFKEYRILGKKGEGTFSEVLKVQDIQDGTYFACKKMKQRYERYETYDVLWQHDSWWSLNRIFIIHKLYWQGFFCFLVMKVWTWRSFAFKQCGVLKLFVTMSLYYNWRGLLYILVTYAMSLFQYWSSEQLKRNPGYETIKSSRECGWSEGYRFVSTWGAVNIEHSHVCHTSRHAVSPVTKGNTEE